MKGRKPHFVTTLYGLLAVVVLIAVGLDLSAKPKFEVTSAGDGTVDLRTTRDLKMGLRLKQNAFVHSVLDPVFLDYEGTTITIGPKTDLQIKLISDERLEFFSERGVWNAAADRTIVSCTRELCATTDGNISTVYVTPGEIANFTGEAAVQVEHRDGRTWNLEPGETFTYDELTDIYEIQEPEDEA